MTSFDGPPEDYKGAFIKVVVPVILLVIIFTTLFSIYPETPEGSEVDKYWYVGEIIISENTGSNSNKEYALTEIEKDGITITLIERSSSARSSDPVFFKIKNNTSTIKLGRRIYHIEIDYKNQRVRWSRSS